MTEIAMKRSTERRDPGDVLTFGFGITLAMWAIGYVSRIPPAVVPNWLLFVGLVASPIVGGFLAARSSTRGWRAGAWAGGIAGAVNLLVLAGVIRGEQAIAGALAWIPASVLFHAVLGGIGGLVGAAAGPRGTPVTDWSWRLAAVTVAMTIVLVTSGGLVTGFEAGLAVPDWPNSFGYFMFSYPLARMTGGIYYEHTHRLYGTLVGLSTVVLALYLAWRDDRRWLKLLGLGAVILVIVQGVMGGLRVTGKPTLSQAAADLEPSTTLAVAHGITGQLFLGLLVAITVFTSTSWTNRRQVVARGTETDYGLSTLLVGALVIQLALGAILRHFAQGVMIHMAMAFAVLGLGLAVGLRNWKGDRPPVLRTTGRWLTILLGVQLALGVAAVVVTGVLGGERAALGVEVPFTSAHQVTGAVLLALSVAAAAFTRRLMLAPAEDAPHAADAGPVGGGAPGIPAVGGQAGER